MKTQPLPLSCHRWFDVKSKLIIDSMVLGKLTDFGCFPLDVILSNMSMGATSICRLCHCPEYLRMRTEVYRCTPCLKKLCKIVFVRTSLNFHQV